MVSVMLDQVSKVFEGEKRTPVHALNLLNLDVRPSECLVLVGPSGSGKSTILRLIAGLENTTSGSIYIGESSMQDVSPRDRQVAMVFQSDTLYPHMNVYDNLAFGLKLRGKPRTEIHARVQEIATMLNIHSCLHRIPETLSGGERQRVALGRSMVLDPKVFLLDEPFSSLDTDLRTRLRLELKSLHRKLGCTMIVVTHDQAEALALGDRIAVIELGTILQVGTPSDVYHRPSHVFVAQFLGRPPMNLVRGFLEYKKESVHFTESSCSESGFKLVFDSNTPLPSRDMEGREVLLGFRPEQCYLCPVNDPEMDFAVVVETTEFLGSETIVHVQSQLHELAVRQTHLVQACSGTQLGLRINRNGMVWFDSASGKSVPI